MSYPFIPKIKTITFNELIKQTHNCFENLPDLRKGAPQTKYTIKDAALSALSTFFMQCPSFLAYQRDMQNKKGTNNAKSLFLINQIPSDNWIRTLLDPIPPEYFYPRFDYVFEILKPSNHLNKSKSINDNLLIPLDGTGYFSSNTIHCNKCSIKQHKNGTTSYFHSVITPVIVSPENNNVISLEPEFIFPQDGNKKQDCENAAAKRWILKYSERYKKIGATILGDDLYSRQPLCELILDEELNFILVCKPSSHKTLYEWIYFLETESITTVETKPCQGKKTRIYTYRCVNDVPLRDGDDALKVNWCELTITNEKGKTTYKNSWITNHLISKENIVELVKAARARWKVENENNNTLKTKGYHLEHNFGHGKKYLSSTLVTLNLLAFLLHTLLDMMDSKYQLIRQRLGTRKTIFNDFRALTRYLLFDSWDDLLLFMMEKLKIIQNIANLDEILIFDTG
jgi:hypothetical protein